MYKIFIKRVFLLFSVFAISCGKIIIPPKTSKLNDFSYNEYKTKLEKGISEKDNFEIGVQLCNLGVSKDTVYRFLRKGILESKKNCMKALEWNNLYETYRFKVNVIKLDTNAWVKLCLICKNDKNAVEAFNQKLETDLRKADERRKLIKIDSSKLDKILMNQLDTILKDDQKYRLLMDNEETWWPKQKHLDSINLKKIEQIIINRSYPSYREVGYDLVDVIWLVLHHQSNVAIRKKYLPYLEDALKNNILSEGLIAAYDYRTKSTK